ncbi:hepatic leukemia factor-like [Kryptolebias marmoratus]|uniref:hepatic leukemia factor-like n=1 Tax=Kryptolebias marmoratus TaxID=37003 RepID=UPI0007F8D609|nr:hepatic leukemia factor-like [Kryptolebias marmoratus]
MQAGVMEKMSRAVPLHPNFVAPGPHGVLKSLLENPLKLPLHHEASSKQQEKEKNLQEERSAPQSAFLGPTLWDKTLSYDGDTFQLEYMDLEEFLSENGILSSPSQHHADQHQTHVQPRQPPILPQAPPTEARTVMDLSNHASTSVQQTCLHSSPAGNYSAPKHPRF